MEFAVADWYTGKYLRLDWTIRNLASADLTGSEEVEGAWACKFPGLVWGKRRKGGGLGWFSVYGVLSDNWANGDCVDVGRTFTYGKYGFSSIM